MNRNIPSDVQSAMTQMIQAWRDAEARVRGTNPACWTQGRRPVSKHLLFEERSMENPKYTGGYREVWRTSHVAKNAARVAAALGTAQVDRVHVFALAPHASEPHGVAVVHMTFDADSMAMAPTNQRVVPVADICGEDTSHARALDVGHLQTTVTEVLHRSDAKAVIFLAFPNVPKPYTAWAGLLSPAVPKSIYAWWVGAWGAVDTRGGVVLTDTTGPAVEVEPKNEAKGDETVVTFADEDRVHVVNTTSPVVAFKWRVWLAAHAPRRGTLVRVGVLVAATLAAASVAYSVRRIQARRARAIINVGASTM